MDDGDRCPITLFVSMPLKALGEEGTSFGKFRLGQVRECGEHVNRLLEISLTRPASMSTLVYLLCSKYPSPR